MNVIVEPGILGGTIPAIPSKSVVHRLLICAGLSDRSNSLGCRVISEDVRATARCLSALGAAVEIGDRVISVSPAAARQDGTIEMDPGESGSTYRFFTPLVSALGRSVRFTLHGKLPSRPMEPLWDEMERHGVTISGKGSEHPILTGQLTPGEFRIRGDISSQFFTGLLLSLPLLNGDSRIIVGGRLESVGYVAITLEALEQFGVKIVSVPDGFIVPGNQKYTAPERIEAEGDWSNSAFWLCAGAARAPVTVTGLKHPSRQGDSAVLAMLKNFGADVRLGASSVTVAPPRDGGLRETTLDVGDTPDLVPALAIAAAAVNGTTRIVNAGRLRLKESDRIASVCAALQSLGGRTESDDDSITIFGTGRLRGGTVDACGDHRIAMLGATAATLCAEPVEIIGAQATNKSYPGFFDDLAAFGLKVRINER